MNSVSAKRVEAMAENSEVSQGMELKVTERHVLNAMLRQWLAENYNDSKISDKM